MKVVLELQDQPSNIKKVTIRHDIVIGRGAECNLRLSAPQVSRRHCFLRVGNDGASLSDLDSSNGTYMNGKKLTSGKRYRVEDGAILAIGPVKFVARVRSEVPVGEALEVQLQDDRIEADLASPVDGPPVDDMEATIAEPLYDDDASNMNFAIEQGGAAAGEDEPTADYVAADSASADYFSDDVMSEDDDVILPAIPEDDEPPTSVSVDEEIVEVAAIVDDDEVIEVVADDEVDLVDEVVEVADDEVVEVISDDEVVLAEDEDIIEIDGVVEVDNVEELTEDSVAQAAESADVIDVPDEDEAELKDFLKGLD